MKIYLIRHGETEWNKIGKLQGWLDSNLTELGQTQANQLRTIMREKEIDAIFTSDLGRAKKTAHLVFPKEPIYEDRRLREIFLGQWQGKLIRNLQNSEEYQLYINSPAKPQTSHIESFETLQSRMLDALHSIKQEGYNKVAIISHGVAILCLLNKLTNKPLSSLWSTPMPSGGEYIEVTLDKSTLQKIAEDKLSS